MKFGKSISLELETGKKVQTWMMKNGITNFSFAVDHLLKIGLGNRNNGVGVRQEKLVGSIPALFEEVLEEQGIRKSKVMK